MEVLQFLRETYVHVFNCHCRIIYTADSETTDDKAVMVNGLYRKIPVPFKGNMNRDFENVNYDDQKNVEYDEDDDERRPVIPVSAGDFV